MLLLGLGVTDPQIDCVSSATVRYGLGCQLSWP